MGYKNNLGYARQCNGRMRWVGTLREYDRRGRGGSRSEIEATINKLQSDRNDEDLRTGGSENDSASFSSNRGKKHPNLLSDEHPVPFSEDTNHNSKSIVLFRNFYRDKRLERKR